ncbi:MAG: LAGLIDADG family homing endonuclease [Candidatus Aenigmarchaeota archaeon]|nr:LAGLIDADG family homing endonuclease [Candidatus Aenigmarchaeota archaeon]
MKRDKRCKLSIEEESNIASLYQKGIQLSKLAEKFNVSVGCVQNILRAYRIKLRTPAEGIRLLHDHVNIVPPANFPWHLKNKFHKLIGVLLLTDGCVKKDRYTILFVCTDLILQKYFVSLCKERYGVLPTVSYFMKNGKETAIHNKETYLQLRNLILLSSKNFHDKNKEPQLDDFQPSLSFLENENFEALKECIRLAMSTEGSIHTEFIKNSVYPVLEFSCAHPLLCQQWKKIFNRFGIKSYISRSKVTWSGVKGLRIKKLESIEKFIQIGGFIEGVKITGKSKYFRGLSKNSLLKLLYEMRVHSFNFLINHSTVEKKQIIREMVESPKMREKWWKVCVELPTTLKQLEKEKKDEEKIKGKLEKILQKEKLRSEIIQFVKDSSSRGTFPTWKDIQLKFKIGYRSYFNSIIEIYELANVNYPRRIKRIAKKPFKNRNMGRKAIKDYVIQKVKEGVLPSRKEIEKEVRVKFSSYFESVDKAYKYVGIKFKRLSPFKRAILVN